MGGFNLPQANQGGSAPEIEAGLTPLRFDDLLLKPHDDWAGVDKFGHDDDGQRYHFCFTALDEEGKVLYDPNSEGDPIELEILTRTATGEKSNFAKTLKGILTAAEFTAWQANEPFDGEGIKGRKVMGMVEHNKKGWPNITAVLPAKMSKAEKAAALAEAAARAAADAEDGD